VLRKDSGISHDALASACEQLRAARTPEDVEGLIASIPSYLDPAVQAMIFKRLGTGTANEREICQLFFLLLHRGAHLGLVVGRTNTKAPPVSTPAVLPTFHRRLLELVGDRIPAPRRAEPRSRADTEGLLNDLRFMGSAATHADLDPGAMDSRVSWSVLSARCGRCATDQLVVRVHYLDIRSAPDLLALLEHNETASVCQTCGCDVLEPLDVWIQDEPRTGDALGALATNVRVADWLDVYQPPEWGLDVERWRVVLEVRSGFMVKPASPNLSFRSIAYSREQFRRLLALDANDAFRLACDALEFRLEHGLVPLEEIEAEARRVADAGKWPPVHLDSPLPGDRRFSAVAIALLAEALGERQAHPAADRAFLSCQLATAWTAAGEYGPAQAAVARAKSAIAELSFDASGRDALETLVRGAEGDVLAGLGRRDQAAEMQLAALSLRADEHGTIAERLQFCRVAAKAALTDKQAGRPSDAIPTFGVSTAKLLMLREEVEKDGQGLDVAVSHALSGALANFAGALLDVADDVAAGGDISPAILEVVQTLDELSAPDEVDMPTRMLRAAARLLEAALAISVEYEFWTFAARQAWRSAELCARGGPTLPPEVRRTYLAVTREYARKAMDREMLFISGLALAADDARAGRFDDAIGHVEVAARAWGERRVDAGGIAPSMDESRACASLALRLARAGADPMRATIVVESQKSIRIARSMSVGRLGRAVGVNSSAIIAQYDQLRRRRATIALQVEEADPEHRAPWETEYRRIDAEFDELRRQVFALDPSFVRWSDTRSVYLPGPTDLHQILSALGPRTTLLGTFVEDDRLWSYAAWPGGGAVYAHDDWPTWRADVNALVDEFSSNADPDARRLARISTALLAPIRERLGSLGPADRLVLSQCAELAQVPFSALLCGEKRLIETLLVSQVPGLSVLATMTTQRDGIRRVLLLGAPYRFEPAPPHTLKEVRIIGELFRGTGIAVDERVGSMASPAELLSLAPTADLVHVACHAHWSQSEAHPACLDLAPDDADDGRLTAARIVNDLDARPGAIFVLGACESARFDADADAEVGGLVPALLVAGAGAVVATLWNINDHDALEFHRAFYRHLLAGHAPCEALGRTQREAIRGELGTALSMPKAWPAFVLYGR
jgi:hypothetical protein